jgi:hypothetical protein
MGSNTLGTLEVNLRQENPSFSYLKLIDSYRVPPMVIRQARGEGLGGHTQLLPPFVLANRAEKRLAGMVDVR